MFYSAQYPDDESVTLKPLETLVDNDLRIKFLKEHFLQQIAKGDSGWSQLWKDPNDGRFWEETRFKSEMHGGGYPILINISENTAELKYDAKTH